MPFPPNGKKVQRYVSCGLYAVPWAVIRKVGVMEGIIWLVFTALTVIPLLKLLPHFGINKYWSLACIIPFGVLALIWWMSLKLQELERR